MNEIAENNYPILSVVMPLYNEENTISDIVHRILQVPRLLELIIVDDHSTDKSPQLAESLAAQDKRIRYIRHEANAGKTEALKTGFQLTRGEIVVIQDADLEYDPAELPYLIAPIIEKKADVVYGSRFMIRRAARVLYFSHYLANKVLAFCSNCVTNLNMTDIETCYKAFRGEIIRNLVITSSGFGFEIEVTAKIAKLKVIIYEVPISYYGRMYEEGKKIGYWDGIAALWYVCKYNIFTSRRSSFRELPESLPAAGKNALRGI